MDEETRRLKFLPRFSLRTLLVIVMLFASTYGLRVRWDPWVIDYPGTEPNEYLDVIVVAPDGHTAVAYRYEPKGPEREHQSPTRMKGQFVVDLEGAHPPRLLEASEAEGALHPVFSRDGRFVAGTNKSGLTVWRADTGKIEHFIPVYMSNDNETYLAFGTFELCRFAEFLPDGNTVVASSDQSLYRFDLRKETFEGFLVDHSNSEGDIAGLQLSPDGMRLLRYREHGQPEVYDAENLAKPLMTVRMRYAADVKYWEFSQGRFSDDGLRVLGICQRRYVRICDAQTGALLRELWHDSPHLDNFAESPDGARLLVDTGKEGLVLWDVESGVQRAHLGYGGWVWLRWSDENRTIDAIDTNGARTRYTRRRPEPWWGIAWLPESWLALVFGLGLVWSLVRDWKVIRAKDAASAAPAAP